MEVFNIFATLSLQDLLSGPLGRIRQAMRNVEGSATSLSQRFGNLALSMAPVALAAGTVLGAFGKCVSTAAGFEDQIAKVGAVSRANSEELAELEAKARELGGTTQFTAVQVGEAEQYLAMAGFSVKENVAALPGVLNLAAATATDLGRAADISSDILGAFGMKANEMGRVADVLAMTCSTANTNMELLGETMKYVAPVARTAGLSIEETAAMAGLLGNVGIKGSQAGTTLKAMLNKMAAPAKEAQEVFQKLGITVKDQAGNLRSPIQILREMSGKLKDMGTAEQMAAMKAVVGEEAVAGFAELIKQGGIGTLEEYIKKIQESGGACDKMAEQMNDTLAGSMRGLGSAWESVQISVGKIFIPVVRKAVTGITGLLRLFDKFSQSKFGNAVIRIAGALASAVVAITAFSAAMWAIGKATPMISGVFSGIKAAMLGLGAPIWALIAAIGILYVIWKNDFGGIATIVSGWWNRIKLTFQGVIAVFETLKGTTGEIKGELAKEIKAAGLVKLVTNIGKLVFRIRQFFTGIWEGLNFDKVFVAFAPAVLKIGELFELVGNAISKLFGFEITGAADSAKGLGEIIGKVVTVAFEGLATAISIVVNDIDSVISFFRMLYAMLTGDFSGACEMAQRIWKNFCDSLMGIADFLGIGDWIRDAWSGVTDFFANLNFADAIKGAWDSVVAFLSAINPVVLISQAFSGLSEFFASLNLVDGIRMAWDAVVQFFASLNLFESGVKLIQTLKDGILSMAGSLIESVTGVFSKIRNLLPFSDAKEGPLSELTLSGSRIMTTLGEGVIQGKDALKESVQGALGEVNGELNNWKAEASPLEIQNQAEKQQIDGIPGPGIALPEMMQPAPVEFAFDQMPQVPKIDPIGINTEPMPDLHAPAMLFDQLPEISAISQPEPITIGMGEMPEIPGLQISTPLIQKPEIPNLEVGIAPIPDIQAMEIPQPKAPDIAIPPAPVSFPQDNAKRAETQARPAQGNQHISITIQNITLPDVQNAESFVSSLKQSLQNEIGQFEGATA